jgi:hypothetical protein
VVSALEWAEIRALGKDGVSQREIARRLGSTGGRSLGRWDLMLRRGMCGRRRVAFGSVDAGYSAGLGAVAGN